MGRLEKNVRMQKYTWLSVGGPALAMFYPEDENDLSVFLKQKKFENYLIMGAGSNLLVRDGGVDACVIKISRGLDKLVIEGNEIELGAGLLDRYVSQVCQEHGLSGFEFLSTIPGTIGGGMAMNAGCYGAEFVDRLLWAWVMDTQGTQHKVNVQDLGYGYRSCCLPKGWIFLGGRFKGTLSDPQSIEKTMAHHWENRLETQPSKVKTGGSTFANPPGHSAWKLIEDVGYRGKIKGDAQFSEKHCNFLINRGKATAQDLEDLAQEAHHAVYQKTQIDLRWEIVRWGKPKA